eukprot:5019224-Prymnesium_polylepis.1
MYAAMHDTETYNMMTKRLLSTVDFNHERVRRVEEQVVEMRAEFEKVSASFRAITEAERQAVNELERLEAFIRAPPPTTRRRR